MEGGIYGLIGFAVARLFGWLDNRDKYAYDNKLATLELQNASLVAENVRKDKIIADLLLRVTELEMKVGKIAP